MDIATFPTLDSVARRRIGGLPVADLDREETARLTIRLALERRSTDGPCRFFTTVNGQVISACASDPATRALYEGADVISADGMPVVFASRLMPGRRLRERVATTDNFHDVARLAEECGVSFYLLGGSAAVNAEAVARVRSLYPGLRIAGHRDGYFSRDEELGVVEVINAAAPDVLWVSIGVPLAQGFVARNRAQLDRVGVARTSGGLFDFLAGRNSRAPAWMQALGFEWLHRVVKDPRRFLWRYLTTNPHAFYVLATRTELSPRERAG